MFGSLVKKKIVLVVFFFCILGKFLKSLSKTELLLLRKLVSEVCKESKLHFAIRNKDVLRTRPCTDGDFNPILLLHWGRTSNPRYHRLWHQCWDCASGSTYHRLPSCWHTPGLHTYQWSSETSGWSVSSGSPTCSTLPLGLKTRAHVPQGQYQAGSWEEG